MYNKVILRDANLRQEFTVILTADALADLRTLQSIVIVSVDETTPEDEFFATADE